MPADGAVARTRAVPSTAAATGSSASTTDAGLRQLDRQLQLDLLSVAEGLLTMLLSERLAHGLAADRERPRSPAADARRSRIEATLVTNGNGAKAPAKTA
jgi:hypothetical protein